MERVFFFINSSDTQHQRFRKDALFLCFILYINILVQILHNTNVVNVADLHQSCIIVQLYIHSLTSKPLNKQNLLMPLKLLFVLLH